MSRMAMKALLLLGATFSATPVANADRSLSGIFSPPASAAQGSGSAAKPAEPSPPAVAAASLAEKSSFETERASAEEAAPYVPEDKNNVDFLGEEPEFLADKSAMNQLRNLMKSTLIGDPFYGLHSRSSSQPSKQPSKLNIKPRATKVRSTARPPFAGFKSNDNEDAQDVERKLYDTKSNKHRENMLAEAEDIKKQHAEKVEDVRRLLHGTTAKSSENSENENSSSEGRADVTMSKEEISFMKSEDEAPAASTAKDEGSEESQYPGSVEGTNTDTTAESSVPAVTGASLVEKGSFAKERASTDDAAPYVPEDKNNADFLGEEPEFLADENEMNQHRNMMKSTAIGDPFSGLHSRSSSQPSKLDFAPKARSATRRPFGGFKRDDNEGDKNVERKPYSTNSNKHREDLLALADNIKKQHAEVIDEIRHVLHGTTAKSSENENELPSEGKSHETNISEGDDTPSAGSADDIGAEKKGEIAKKDEQEDMY